MLLGHVLAGLATGLFPFIQSVYGDYASQSKFRQISPLKHRNGSVKAPGSAYQDFKCKTEQMLNHCDHPNGPGFPAQHHFTADDLIRQGWERGEEYPFMETRDSGWLPNTLERLGVHFDKSSPITQVDWMHRSEYVNAQGQHGCPTFAKYENAYAPHLGVIIVVAVYSPEYRIQFTGDPDEALPDIRRWSDFAWEEWVHFCNEASPPVEPGSLKFVLHDDVENDDTKDIANLVLQNEGKQLSTWPGLELDVARSDNGKAMAYTPNSRGVWWLILQHWSQIRKRVTFINWFEVDETQWKKTILAIRLGDA